MQRLDGSCAPDREQTLDLVLDSALSFAECRVVKKSGGEIDPVIGRNYVAPDRGPAKVAGQTMAFGFPAGA